MPIDAPGSTAIVVLAPEAEPLVGGIYRTHSQAGADGMGPHVTLLVPFAPADGLDADIDARLRNVFAASAPLDYALTRLERFPGGVLYLAPEPSRPFADLTRALWSEFPDYPPYEGDHDDVVPHMTAAVGDDEALLERVTRDLEPKLPIACRAEAATIVQRGLDLQWRVRVTFPFGG